VPGCPSALIGTSRHWPREFMPSRSAAHLLSAVPFADLGGHRQPYVIAQNGDQRLGVGLFVRVDVALEQPALLGVRFSGWCPAEPPLGPLIAQFCAGTLEGAVDRRDAHVEQVGDLGGVWVAGQRSEASADLQFESNAA
jgi:hypothetical protein